MAEYIVNTDVEEARYKAMCADYSVYFNNKLVTLLGNPVKERIVRCRDCEYYEYLREIDFHNCDRQCPCVKPDGFCAWGEPKVVE